VSAALDLADSTRFLIAITEKTFIATEELKDTFAPRRDALEFLRAALELKRLASDLHRVAEDYFVDLMGNEKRALVDGTVVEVRRAYRRTDWEHSKLATHVALTALGGEVVEGMDVIVDAFLRACRPEWRITALKEFGLDDEDYCSRELGRATVTVVS
jgi:hypothetical protein